MSDPDKQHSSDNDLTKDQLAEQGIEIDTSAAAIRRGKNYQKDLVEEDKGKHVTSPKAAPAPESESQREENDYYNGMSQ